MIINFKPYTIWSTVFLMV